MAQKSMLLVRVQFVPVLESSELFRARWARGPTSYVARATRNRLALARMVQAGASAADVADALVSEAGYDSTAIAGAFCDAYRTIYPAADEASAPDKESVPHLLAAAYGAGPRRKPPVDTFAEAFFLIPEDARAQVLPDFLANRDEGLHGLLLDQFAGMELADLAPQLDEAAFAELEAYIRDVVDTDLGTADELFPLVSSARDVQGARMSAAERIRTMIEGIGNLGGSSGGLAGQLRAELALGEEKGLYVLTTLLEVEDRTNRLRRVLEAWCERIGELIRDAEFDIATVQIDAAWRGVTAQYKVEFMEEMLAEFVGTECQLLIDTFQLDEHRDQLIDLLGRFGERSAEQLMRQLAGEDSPTARHALIGILAGVAAIHPDPMDRFFAAEEWYVVRNAVTIASKVGGERWISRIQPLTAHEDHRVVVESLRALAAVAPERATGELVGCLTHDHERVVETAALLLRASSAHNLEETLVAAMLNKSMDPTARSEMAEVLFKLGTPGAMQALEGMARRPFLLTSHRRDARRAARSILASAA